MLHRLFSECKSSNKSYNDLMFIMEGMQKLIEQATNNKSKMRNHQGGGLETFLVITKKIPLTQLTHELNIRVILGY